MKIMNFLLGAMLCVIILIVAFPLIKKLIQLVGPFATMFICIAVAISPIMIMEMISYSAILLNNINLGNMENVKNTKLETLTLIYILLVICTILFAKLWRNTCFIKTYEESQPLHLTDCTDCEEPYKVKSKNKKKSKKKNKKKK